jgi:hypothetical protein
MADIFFDVDTALAEVPVCLLPLIDDTDFKTREESVTYNQAGLDLVWNFVTTGGAFTQTAVTPTTSSDSGNYDWTNQGNGLYTIEIPASGGASINNDTEGFGWFTGYATGVLPWRGPTIGFRASGLNDLLIDSAYSTTRGLAGTALPNAAADAAGGLIISDAGGLDADAQRSDVAAILVDTGTTLQAEIDGVQADTEDIQSRLPAALVSGRMDSNVQAIANGAITALAIATDAIDADAIASDAVTEIQSGLATPTNITAGTITTVTNLTNNNDKTGYALSSAGIQAIWDALTSALTTIGSIGKLFVDNINATISSRASQTSLDTMDDFVDTEVSAIKGKTDQLTFTKANEIDANVQSLNGTTLNGDGSTTPWGP